MKEAYMNWLNETTHENVINYKKIRGMTRKETRKIRRQIWSNFVNRMKHVINGPQLNGFKVIRKLMQDKNYKLSVWAQQKGL